jgi:hypothetical protein
MLSHPPFVCLEKNCNKTGGNAHTTGAIKELYHTCCLKVEAKFLRDRKIIRKLETFLLSAMSIC